MLGSKIIEARRAKGWTQAELAERMNTSQQTIQRYEAGARNLKANVLVELSKVLNVTVAYLLGMTDAEVSNTDSVEVPLYGYIAAGKPLEMETVDQYYPIPAEVHNKWPNSYLLRVEGESMNHILPNGCYALIYPCSEIDQDSQPYVVRVGDLDATVKRVRKLDDGYILLPDSSDENFQPQMLVGEDATDATFSIIGRVVWHCLPFDWAY